MSTHDASFRVLMDRVVQGDDTAAARIVDEFTAVLVAVARREIGPKLQRRVDADDVVQSAYRSFFVRMAAGEYDLGSGSELWKLLLTITLNKVRKQGRHHGAQKRNVAQDCSVNRSSDVPMNDLAISDDPSPEDAAILVDEVSVFLSSLRPADRTMVELRLQGHSSIEIAKQTGHADRTVRRVLQRVERRLSEADD